MAEKEKGTMQTQVIRGLTFPASPKFSKKNIEDAMDYVPKDGDLVIASYPKTGTTWMQYIVLQILSNGEYFPPFEDVTYKLIPYAELAGIAAVEALQKPRCYKHHIPYNMVQKSEQSKCIYTYRHPEDTVVSYYHFLSDMDKDVHYDFDEFFDSFVSDNISYGCYFKHVMSFYERREDPNLLMVSYEKLQANRREEILRIAKFMDVKYYGSLTRDEETLGKIIKHTSFEYMKSHLYLTIPLPGEQGTEQRVNFFRKGIVGDGKNMLTEMQRQRMRETAIDLMKGTTIVQEWYPE